MHGLRLANKRSHFPNLYLTHLACGLIPLTGIYLVDIRYIYIERINQIPAGIYVLKVNHRNTRTRCELCSKLTTKIPERRHWSCSGIFIVNSEHTLHLVLVFLLLTFNM